MEHQEQSQGPALEPSEVVAIMFTDVVERPRAQRAPALASALREEHGRLVRRLVASHGGRVVKRLEEGFLLEFQEARAAVACGLELQSSLAARNAQQPREQWLELRVGIHLGAVVHQEGDVFGEGVNLAARLEALAPPGAIYVSAPVVAQLGTLPAPVRRLGRGALKGIRLPVAVYRIDPPGQRRRSLLARLGTLLPSLRPSGWSREQPALKQH